MSVAFFFIALVYSSAGFGGGSMYISALSQFTTLTSLPLRFNALVCNATVTGQSLVQWRSAITLRKSAYGLLLVTALPCGVAVLFPLTEVYFLKTLGIALMLAGGIMAIQEKWQHWQLNLSVRQLHIASFFIGGIAGFTGIGGGIYLSPLLHLSRWGNAKEIAQLSAWFIFLNSLISIFIMCRQGAGWADLDGSCLIAVFLGGILGSRISISWLKIQHIRWITAFLLIFAGIRIVLK